MPSNILLCAVSLMLAVLLWRGAQGKALPLTHSRDFDGQICSQHAKVVLSNIRELMNNKELFFGFNCSETAARASNRTATVSACAPTVSNDCLVSIRADMEYYKTVLKAYPLKHPALSEMVKATSYMLERCASGNPFDDRLCLCEVVQDFKLRAVTINRALGYIASGEHRD
ncbi:hypothetical protein ACEWY4_008087 [Coilia grayii]|uniref:Interleukin-12 subunit alpha n=1 Tax=Coilia grayii TaxID=363190 RepID=A0ABD1K9U8_9TELE